MAENGSGMDKDIKRDRSRSRSPLSKRSDSKRRDSGRYGSRSSGDRDKGTTCRVYVANIPYDMKWQDLKDLFREKVGDVSFVELFEDMDGKPRGCGVVEFRDPALVETAVRVLHRSELKGRQIVVKEDFDGDRDKTGRLLSKDRMGGNDRGRMGGSGGSGGGGGGGGGRRTSGSGGGGGSRMGLGGMGNMGNMGGGDMMNNMGGGMGGAGMGNMGNMDSKGFGNTYGLSPQFLESLGISGPLTTRVFVANLDYNVTEKKIRDVFRLAGRVTNVEFKTDKDGKSKGHGTVEFEHPVEAVQAISMFNGQMLFDRKMSVRMDRFTEKDEVVPSKLPAGLKGIGMGLGSGGLPLKNFASMSNMNSGPPNVGPSGVGGNGSGMSGMGTTGMNVGMPMGMGGMGNSGMGGMGGGGGLVSGMGSGMGSSGLDMKSGTGLAGAMGGGNLGFGGGGLASNAPSMMGSSLAGVGGIGSPVSGGGPMGSGLASAMSSSGGMGSNQGGGGMGGGMGYEMSSNRMGSSGMGGAMGSSLVMGGGNLGSSSGFGGNGGTGGGVSDIGRNDFDFQERDYRQSSDNFGMLSASVGTGGGPGSTSGSRSSDTICVRNLPSTYTWQALRDKFRTLGDVKFAEMRGRGMGVVRFASERDAQRATHLMDGARVEGRIVEVFLQ